MVVRWLAGGQSEEQRGRWAQRDPGPGFVEGLPGSCLEIDGRLGKLRIRAVLAGPEARKPAGRLERQAVLPGGSGW